MAEIAPIRARCRKCQRDFVIAPIDMIDHFPPPKVKIGKMKVMMPGFEVVTDTDGYKICGGVVEMLEGIELR